MVYGYAFQLCHYSFNNYKHYESRDKVSTIIREIRQEEEEVVKKEKIFKESISIAEAKQGLSKYYGTPEENIEIIIRG